jgi:DNA-binding transcriptional MerR regulator
MQGGHMSFTKNEVAEKTGLKPRQVQFYTERLAVLPEVDAGEGRGKVRRYSEKNLYEFAVIRQLVEYGITISKVKVILDAIRGTGILGKGLKKTDGRMIIYQRENGRYIKPVFNLSVGESVNSPLMKKYDSAIVINLRRVLNNLN